MTALLPVLDQVGSLQMKIVAEDKAVEQKTHELLQEWEKGKPVRVSGVVYQARLAGTLAGDGWALVLYIDAVGQCQLIYEHLQCVYLRTPILFCTFGMSIITNAEKTI